MSSSDAVLYVRSKLQQSRHRHQLPLSAVRHHVQADADDEHHDDEDYGLIIFIPTKIGQWFIATELLQMGR